MFEYAKGPNVGPNAGWPPHNDKIESLEIIKSFIEKDNEWAIVHKQQDKVIGSIGLHHDGKRVNNKAKMIGYVLSEPYWGQGLMTEAVKRAMKYAFEYEKLDILSVFHHSFNIRSKRVIEKCGFQFEGILRSASVIYNGNIYDDVCYSLTKEEYFAK